MTSRTGAGFALCCALWAWAEPVAADDFQTALRLWRAQFASEVSHQREVPTPQQQAVSSRVQQTLAQAGHVLQAAQAVLVIDRAPAVQAAYLLVFSPEYGWQWLGATAVSTGKPGRFEHFYTPLGVFAHTPDHPDFRSEGTYNSHHIRGYGERGMRVFDFGWQQAERGWGGGGRSQMRLAMHATDPQQLAQRLGSVDSEGCIRIPAALNVFLDMHGVLDADYEAAVMAGKPQRVLRSGRQPVPWPGRYLVVIETEASAQPAKTLSIQRAK